MDILFYCRAGYEADLLAEFEHNLTALGLYGFARLSKGSAFFRYTVPSLTLSSNTVQEGQKINALLPQLCDLVFARQKLLVIADVIFDNEDRISTLLNALQDYNLPTFSDVIVEYPDTEQGKKLAKFCKKFTVPLRSKLRQHGLLSKKVSLSNAFLHLFFQDSGACIVAMSVVGDRHLLPLGNERLKMPSAAPSRSTLKLEEAIHYFLNKNQANALFCAQMRACDLGACPGGWTYQLVQRKMVVEAVDHGEMADSLMTSPLVEYYKQDGFLYQPQQSNVDWLVCDMIEQPTRVSELMLHWLVSGKANACIFNLKLPMSKRYRVVNPIINKLTHTLGERFGNVVIKAKHLYHNRDEVTIMVIVNTQMLAAYHDNV